MPSSVSGVQTVLKAFGKARSQDAIKIADAIQKCGDVILRKALVYCPIEHGDLRATGKAETIGRGLGAKCDVTFGGLSPTGREVNYAVIVHDDMTKSHAPPTGARFLTRAVRETRGTCASILRRNMSLPSVSEAGDIV
jgi:hypothetical protein